MSQQEPQTQTQKLNTVVQNTAQGKEEHLYKVIVIGDYAVGKTSLIRRYCEGYFSQNYKLTIGVDFAVKTVEWDDKTRVTLQLWDVAGHERFGTMTRVYYKYAIAGIIVFDVTRLTTFEAVVKWKEDVNSKVVLANDEPIPLLLLANKCDLPDIRVDKDTIDEFAKQHGFIGWFYTSAQNNTNIDEAMNFLIEKILEVAKKNRPKTTESTVVTIGSQTSSTQKSEKIQFNRCCG